MDTLRQRLDWTRIWLDSSSRPTLLTSLSTNSHEAAECVEQTVLLASCSTISSPFSLIDNDLGSPFDEDDENGIIALSSGNTAGVCDEYSGDDGATGLEPSPQRRICENLHTVADQPSRWCSICQDYHGPDGKQIVRYAGDEQVDSDDPAPMTTSDGIDYALAGRQDDNTFRDLRSSAKARKRKQTDRYKYYGYKYVNPGQINAPHLTFTAEYDCRQPLCDCCEVASPRVVLMSKKQLYIEAQQYPRPPKRHRRKKEKDYNPWSSAFERRQALWKHADYHLAEAEEQHSDDVRTQSDNSVIEWHEDWCDEQIDDRSYPHCNICDVEWGRCRDYQIFEVDNIDEIEFQTDRTRRHKQGWRMRWKAAGRGVSDNRAPAVLSYGKMDWDMRPGVELFDQDDSIPVLGFVEPLTYPGSTGIRNHHGEEWEQYEVK